MSPWARVSWMRQPATRSPNPRLWASTLAIAVSGLSCSSSSGQGDTAASVGGSGGAGTMSTSSTGLGGATQTSSTDATVTEAASSAGGTSTSNTGGLAGAGGTSSVGGTGGSGSSWEGCEEFEMPSDCSIPDGAVLPGELRCTGLYSDWEARTLRCGVEPYAPAYQLWTDGAGKQRYVWLPPGTTIDVSDPDDWDYPVGTRFWKEFWVGPEGEQKLGETRYLLRSEAGWLYTAYVWDEAGTVANQENDGVDDLFGTGHTVPSREQCKTCHNGREEFILGWDYLMLGAGASGMTLEALVDADRLSEVDATRMQASVPGDEIERAALTYMHANCGVSCHNTTLDAAANASGLFLRLEVDALDSVLSTGAGAAINQPPSPNAMFSDLPDLPSEPLYDFRPLDPERSLVLARMAFRGSESAMPPLGTHVADPAGVAMVRAFIEAMSEERGYPAPAD